MCLIACTSIDGRESDGTWHSDIDKSCEYPCDFGGDIECIADHILDSISEAIIIGKCTSRETIIIRDEKWLIHTCKCGDDILSCRSARIVADVSCQRDCIDRQ